MKLFGPNGNPVRASDADKPLSIEAIKAMCAATNWASIRERLDMFVTSPLVDANGRPVYSKATKIGSTITVRRPGKVMFTDGSVIASKDLD